MKTHRRLKTPQDVIKPRRTGGEIRDLHKSTGENDSAWPHWNFFLFLEFACVYGDDDDGLNAKREKLLLIGQDNKYRFAQSGLVKHRNLDRRSSC